MIFNSVVFLLFYAIVLAGYFGIRGWAFRKAFLVLASFVFYGSYRPAYILILLVLICFDFWVALRLHAIQNATARKAFMVSSLALNLGFLAFFKYTNFFLESTGSLTAMFGSEARFDPLEIFLPIGISFHVFQSMAYVIDTYKREIEPCRSLLDFMLFVSFFPQLVAGPIVRAHDFLPQLDQPRSVTENELGWAAIFITIGLFEKVVLADAILGPIADKVYQAPVAWEVGSRDAWIGTLAFAGQIFFDFNGYSVCAVGTALALGFHLPWNFRFPYAAIGFSDFWQRWHISLSQWFRDYLYIPLGGNRHGIPGTLRNLFITMFLAGLWHGAAWHYVIWGVLHGFYLVLERLAHNSGMWPDPASPWPYQVLGAAVTFVCVCIAWVFFRSSSFEHALVILQQMLNPFSAGGVTGKLERSLVLIVMTGLVATHARLRNTTLEAAVVGASPSAISASVALMLVALISVGGEARGFIYFQF
jgi:alginate O-acetyltransferase complex protein AlgI